MQSVYETVRDLSPDEAPEHRRTDLRSFFRLRTLSPVSHASRPVLSDITDSSLPRWRIAQPLVLCIWGLRTSALRDIVSRDVGMFSWMRRSTAAWRIDLSWCVRISSPSDALDVRHLWDNSPRLRKRYMDLYCRAVAPVSGLSRWYGSRLPEVAALWMRAVARWGLSTLAVLVFIASILAACTLILRYDLEAAYTRLVSLANVSSIPEATLTLSEARFHFTRSRVAALPLRPLAALPLEILSPVRTALALTDGWHAASTAANDGMALMHRFFEEYESSLFAILDEASQHDENIPAIAMTARLSLAESELVRIRDHLQKSLWSYAHIPAGDIPPELHDAFESGMEKLSSLHASLSMVLDHFDEILYALGDTKPMRYLVLNQNRDEIRASGGFPGSLVFIEIYRGNILSFDMLDVYDIDWKIAPYRESPPPPLRQLTDNFWLRDANYFLDFDESAQKINFFFEKAGRSSLDGVLAINQGIIHELLRRYGSIALPSIDREIDHENFSLLISAITEAKLQPYKQIGRDDFLSPKAFLFEFAQALWRKLVAKKDIPGYIEIFREQADAGEILFSGLGTPALASLAQALHLDQRWRKTDASLLYPVYTSLSGNKSDRFMKRSVALDRTKTESWYCRHTLSIVDRHTFDSEDGARIRTLLAELGVPESEHAYQMMIQWQGINRQYLRILVPEGAAFVEGNREFDRIDAGAFTRFSTDIQTAPGKASTTTLVYDLPENMCEKPVEFVKQPGLTVQKLFLDDATVSR